MYEILIVSVVSIALYIQWFLFKRPRIVVKEVEQLKNLNDALKALHCNLIALRHDEAAYTILRLVQLKDKSVAYGYKDRCVALEIIRTLDVKIDEYLQDVVIPTPEALESWILERSKNE